MKKTFLVFFACLATLLSFPQFQRLAVLPSALKIAGSGVGNLPSLCLDYFREVPTNQTLGHNTSPSNAVRSQLGNAQIDANSYSSVNLSRNGNAVDQDLDDIAFVSPQDDLNGISGQKAEFLKSRVDYYKTQGDFTDTDLFQLQDEIWAFDVLELLGYISDADAPATRFTAARTRFAAEFGLSPQNITNSRILSIAARLKNENKAISIIRKAGTNDFILFEGFGAKKLSGDLDEIASYVASKSTDANPVNLALGNFESVLNEEAFLISLQRKLRINHSKDIPVTLGNHPEIWEPKNYTLAKAVDDADIKPVNDNGISSFEGTVNLVDNLDEYSYVIAGSNKRNIVSRFLTTISNAISSLTTPFILGRLSKQVKDDVISGIDLAAGDYLDVLIITEGGSKTIVKITKDNVDVFYEVAAR